MDFFAYLFYEEEKSMKKIVLLFTVLLSIVSHFPIVAFASLGTVHELPTIEHIVSEVPFTESDEKEKAQYTVILKGASFTMRGPSMLRAQELIRKFASEAGQSKQEHNIAIVSYNTTAQLIQDFTQNLNEIYNNLSSVMPRGGTNLTEALKKAEELFDQVPENSKKNILLITDRTPTTGEKIVGMPYTSRDIHSFGFANAAHLQVNQMKEQGVTFRSFVFLDKIASTTRAFAKRFYDEIQTHGLYHFTSAENVDFLFNGTENGNEYISGAFSYGSSMGDRDARATFHYSDSYFEKSSYAYQENVSQPYNPSLATMSLNLQLSAWASPSETDYIRKSRNAKELFDKIGFEQFRANQGFVEKPSRDSIGAVAAQKKIDVHGVEYTLIALAIRGGGYEAEWASNLTLGREGKHQGFAEARDNVLIFLDNYVKEANVQGKVKLWVTGFSRAGATANLVGGAINNGWRLSQGELGLDNLYVFCFEPPAGALLSDNVGDYRHNNIINIVNPNDIVTKVAPEIEPFGFRRYGIDYFLPDQKLVPPDLYDTLKDKMLIELAKIESSNEYKVDNFQMKKFSTILGIPNIFNIVDDEESTFFMTDFLDLLIDTLAIDHVKNRPYYVWQHERNMRQLAAAFQSTRKEDREKFFIDLIVNTVSLKIENIPGDILHSEIVKLLNVIGLADFDDVSLVSIASTLYEFVLLFAINNLDLLPTAIKNFAKFGEAHLPEICLAWLRSQDKNYTNEVIEYEITETYKKVLIYGDVNLTLKNQDNFVVDEVQAKTISERPQVFSLLPKENYELNLTASDDTTINAMVQTIDSSSGNVVFTEKLNQLKMKANESITIAFSDDVMADFTLVETGKQRSIRELDILVETDEEKLSRFYRTNVETEGDEFGEGFGSGSRPYGYYKMLHVVTDEKGEFLGWYLEGELVSNDVIYYHKVTKESTLVAKFKAGVNE